MPPTVALTDSACRAAACPDNKARKRISDAGGLYLEVTPTGAKLWRWKYQSAGKEKRLALGAYPDISLKQARLDRDAARAKLEGGTDPLQARKDDRMAQRLRLGNTFEAVARAWWANWASARSERHAGYVMRRLEADVFPEIGAKAVTDITARNCLRWQRRSRCAGPWISPAGRGRPAARCSSSHWRTAKSIATLPRTYGPAQR